jgi:hypothetical protein
MTNADFLRGPWQAVLSVGGDIIPDLSEAYDGDVDICIVRSSAIPVTAEDDVWEWPKRFSGDDMIELWDDIEPDEAERRWAQAQAMAAGLNAAGGAN